MKRVLTKEQILSKLKEKYKEDHQLLPEVAYNLALASVTEANIYERADRALRNFRQSHAQSRPNVLQESAKNTVKSKLSVCPLCKMEMDSVKLLEGRGAFYCGQHKIVQPYPLVDD